MTMQEEPSDLDLDLAFAGRSAFHDALRRLLAEAARRGTRELLGSDGDFADWPLDDAGVLAALAAWVRPQRRLVLLASHYDEVPRRFPRWVAWRRVWAHAVACRQADAEIPADDVPVLLIAPGIGAVRLLDRVRHRGVASTAAVDVVRARSDFDAVSQRSSEAFGATTLGL